MKTPVTIVIIPFKWTPQGSVVAFSEVTTQPMAPQPTRLGRVEREEFLSLLYHVTYFMELIFKLIFGERVR